MTDPENAGVVGRPFLFFPAAILVSLALDRLLPLPFQVPGIDLAYWGIGGSLILVGLVLFAAGVRNFSRADTSLPTNRPARVLVTSGIYGWSRNPVYVKPSSPSFRHSSAGRALLPWPGRLLYRHNEQGHG